LEPTQRPADGQSGLRPPYSAVERLLELIA